LHHRLPYSCLLLCHASALHVPAWFSDNMVLQTTDEAARFIQGNILPVNGAISEVSS